MKSNALTFLYLCNNIFGTRILIALIVKIIFLVTIIGGLSDRE